MGNVFRGTVDYFVYSVSVSSIRNINCHVDAGEEFDSSSAKLVWYYEVSNSYTIGDTNLSPTV